MIKVLGQSIRIFFFFTLLTGAGYPLLITVIAQGGFPALSRGSLVESQGTLRGSTLIAQGFKEPRYFWPRPSAVDYNPLPSGGSNLSATSEALKNKVAERAAAGLSGELLYASASGLDPHVSPAGALAQVDRVAAGRGLDSAGKERLREVVMASSKERFAGFLGDPTVNVLELNLSVDAAFRK